MADASFHEMADGRTIAYRHNRGTGPAIVFLPGYMSDMAGSKATALWDWAAANGRECLLFDYSGCGESPGDFADGTLSRWCEEAVALVRGHLSGRIVLVGSSMGGWLMLLAARDLADHLSGLVGIAAAPDFTEWGYGADERARLAEGQTVFRDNPYGSDPTPTHAGFWQDGQGLKLLDAEIGIDAPVRLLHGQADAEVPPDISLRTAERLRSSDVQVTLVKHGDHRLSRPEDIDLLLRTVAAIA